MKGSQPYRVALSMAEVVEPQPIGLQIQWGDQADPCTGVVVQASRSIRVMYGHLMLHQGCLYLFAWIDVAVISQRTLDRQPD